MFVIVHVHLYSLHCQVDLLKLFVAHDNRKPKWDEAAHHNEYRAGIEAAAPARAALMIKMRIILSMVISVPFLSVRRCVGLVLSLLAI